MGHPVAFGVPRGAYINGQPAPSANRFVVKWRRNAHEEGAATQATELARHTQGVEWMQFKLNDAEDDIEILQDVKALRQKGFESGEAYSTLQPVVPMNESFVQAVPFNRDATEWADCNHFINGRVAVLKYRFNSTSLLYEWVETGPYIEAEGSEISEASLARFGDDWIVAARGGPTGMVWFRMNDPFSEKGKPIVPDYPTSNAPISAYTCPDGVLRLLTGSPQVSSYGNGRDPLYCWDIDADHQFAASNLHVVFDTIAAKLPIRMESYARVEMAKFLPHSGGNKQTIVHRVRTKSINYPCNTKVAINKEEKACTALYYAEVEYENDYPGVWSFEP
jgi:hypothetical protein